MASDNAIMTAFALFRGAGLPFPSDPIVASAMPAAWRMTLEHIDDADLLSAVRRHLQADPPPVYWPKSTELAALARSGGAGRDANRPDFATLRRAYFAARSAGSHDVASFIPLSVRGAILAKLDAVGGLSALRRVMMAQGTFDVSRFETAFNAAPGSALVGRGDG